MEGKCIDKAGNFVKLIHEYTRKGQYSEASMAIKTLKIPLTPAQQEVIDKYKKTIDEAIAENKKANEKRNLKRNLGVQKNIREIRDLKRRIANPQNAKILEELYKKIQEEIKVIISLGMAEKGLALQAEADYLYAWTLRSIDTKKSLEAFEKYFESFGQGTAMKALYSYGIVMCYCFILEYPVKFKLSAVDKGVYNKFYSDSLLTVDKEFKALGVITDKDITLRRSRKKIINFVAQERKNILK